LAPGVSRIVILASCLVAGLTLGAAVSALRANAAPASLSEVPLPSIAPSPTLPLPSPLPSAPLPIPSPLPSPTLPLPSPLPSPSLLSPSPSPLSPSPSPSASLPPLQSAVPSGLSANQSPTVSSAVGAPADSQTEQDLASAPAGPGGLDPNVRGAAGAYSARSGSAPSPAASITHTVGVCPVLGGGGNGCQGLPTWLVQQLAETGYRGVVALLAGVILCLAGIAGLRRGRRRRQASP
jgi:hypothetical protein